MKTAFYVESYGRQVEEKALIAKIKEIWVAEGNKIKDIKDLNIYAKPEDDACYYTINGDFSGHIKLYEYWQHNPTRYCESISTYKQQRGFWIN